MAASVLICVSCQRAACLVKSGNQNISGDGVRVEVAEPAVQSRTGKGLNDCVTAWLIGPSNQLFAQTHFITGSIEAAPKAHNAQG